MLAGVIVLGLLAAVWLFSQQTSTADAPGHCEGATSEMGQKLSYDEIVALASNAGFGSDALVAAAIAFAESGGDPQAYNREPQDAPGGHTNKYGRTSADDNLGSYGLWQIYLAAHPEFSGQDLTDPQINANAALKVYYDSGGFKAWSAYKSGKYQEYLNA